jgi:hypothetical protein
MSHSKNRHDHHQIKSSHAYVIDDIYGILNRDEADNNQVVTADHPDGNKKVNVKTWCIKECVR